MEALYQLDAGLPNSICLTRIWDSIAPESTLRRMIVDKAIVYIERSYLIDNMDGNPQVSFKILPCHSCVKFRSKDY